MSGDRVMFVPDEDSLTWAETRIGSAADVAESELHSLLAGLPPQLRELLQSYAYARFGEAFSIQDRTNAQLDSTMKLAALAFELRQQGTEVEWYSTVAQITTRVFISEIVQRHFNISQAVHRGFSLAFEMAKPLVASVKGEKFFTRLAISWMLGDNHACIVLTGATLERELDAEIANDLCFEHLSPAEIRPNQTPTLDQRITVAHRAGILDFEGFSAADRVRRARNRSIHQDSVASDTEAMERIRDLLEVLRQLDASSG